MPAPSPLEKDQWKESGGPDYIGVHAWRRIQLARFELDPRLVASAKAYYKTRPVEFICHWCDTYDPRHVGTKKPAYMPFVLFMRQSDLVEFIESCLKVQTNGLVEKTRDMGASWICVALSVWLWLFWPGAAIGWGSRKAELVDKIGDPKSIFEKIRILIGRLPKQFLPSGFLPHAHMTHMKIINPENEATITGEVGDNIGRGGRTLIYFKDESAHYARAESIEAALSDNTNVQIDISSVNGLGNVFHRKREAGVDWLIGEPVAKGRTNVFVMDWSDHPEKDEEWHELRRLEAERNGLLHIFAQEVDRNYAASVEGVVIPAPWILAAIDAHIKLGFSDNGGWCAALDVADEGGDRNALTKRKGVILKYAEEWGEVDTGKTTRRAVACCTPNRPIALQYDCIGVGAGVRSESNRLREDREMREQMRGVSFVPWNAGAAVLKPDDRLIRGDSSSPLNKDFFKNLKAQGWWSLRMRFEKTYRAIMEGIEFDSDELISLDSTIPILRQIQKELGQPTITHDSKMRIMIDKRPDGVRSPNVGDSIMMNYFPLRAPMVISSALLATAVGKPRPGVYRP